MADSSVEEKKERSLEVITRALKEAGHPGMPFTGRNESMVLLHLIRTAAGGRIPVSVLHIDAIIRCPEIHVFLEKMKKLWNLAVVREGRAFSNRPAGSREWQEDSSETIPFLLKEAVESHGITHLFTAACQETQETERSADFFTPCGEYVMVNPIVHFTLEEIRQYMRIYAVPGCSLYQREDEGKSPYGGSRSMEALPAMAGVHREEEETIRKLKNLGYL